VLGREAVGQAADAAGLAVWAVEMDGPADDANA
jgi:hypothetical protein